MRYFGPCRILSIVAAAAVVVLAGCGGGQGSAVPASPYGSTIDNLAQEKASLHRGAATHLYVSDGRRGAILRFALKAGIPAATPDAIIGTFDDLRGLAIDAKGRLYVIDGGAETLSIYPASPTTGSQPLLVLPVGHQYGLDSVAVDGDGRVYVNWFRFCDQDGFSCAYSDVYGSFDSGLQYIKTLSFGGGNGSGSGAVLRSMSFDQRGRLASELTSDGPAVYDDVLQGGVPYPLFCGGSNVSGLAWGSTVELFETDLGVPSHDPARVVVVPNYLRGNISNCPSFYSIVSSTLPLKNPIAIATNGTYVYVTSSYEKAAESAIVFVFDPAKPGAQRPVAVIDGPRSLLESPIALAIGP